MCLCARNILNALRELLPNNGALLMTERLTIFISHATPEDNKFSVWLAVRLMSFGYDVWCDQFNLSKGGDFWVEIEKQIRNKTCKFLLVQSSVSNTRDGVLKEVAVAQKVRRQLNDANFIIPLRIDNGLQYDDISVDVIRLNSIDFTRSWATGLQELHEALIKQQCPQSLHTEPGFSIIDNMLGGNRTPVEKREIYDSNWFELDGLPKTMHYYPLNSDKVVVLGQPFMLYRKHLVSFLPKDELPENLKSFLAENQPEYHLSADEFLNKETDIDFIKARVFRTHYIGVLTKVFECSIKCHKGIQTYAMSGKSKAFYFPTGFLPKDKVGRIQLIGKHRQYTWHFALSGNVKMFPCPVIQMRSHVVFSSDGSTANLSDTIQHKCRRSIGKCWWNKDWRSRLLAFTKAIETESGGCVCVLGEGVSTPIMMKTTPIQFTSNVSYNEPGFEAEQEMESFANSEFHAEDGGEKEDV